MVAARSLQQFLIGQRFARLYVKMQSFYGQTEERTT